MPTLEATPSRMSMLRLPASNAHARASRRPRPHRMAESCVGASQWMNRPSLLATAAARPHQTLAPVNNCGNVDKMWVRGCAGDCRLAHFACVIELVRDVIKFPGTDTSDVPARPSGNSHDSADLTRYRRVRLRVVRLRGKSAARASRRAFTRCHSSSGMIRSSGASKRSHSDSSRLRCFLVPPRTTFWLRFQTTSPRQSGRCSISRMPDGAQPPRKAASRSLRSGGGRSSDVASPHNS
jgi:hypothetical protein